MLNSYSKQYTISKYVCMYICIYADMYLWKYVYIYIYTYINIYIIYTYTYIYTYIYKYVYIYIHIHLYWYIYISEPCIGLILPEPNRTARISTRFSVKNTEIIPVRFKSVWQKQKLFWFGSNRFINSKYNTVPFRFSV